LAAIAVAAVAAFSGIWLVRYYPGWAITYSALGALVVFALTSYERGLHAGWPWAPLRAHVANVFALKTKGVNVPRGVAVAGLALITLVVASALHQQRYFLSVAFGLLFVALSDPPERSSSPWTCRNQATWLPRDGASSTRSQASGSRSS